MEPNREHIKAWVEALRSGAYKQGIERLRTKDDGNCCLGVACDISKLGEWIQNDPDGLDYSVDGSEPERSWLPQPVRKWLGIVAKNPSLVCKEGKDHKAGYLNDDVELSFEEIADAIEETYLKEVAA